MNRAGRRGVLVAKLHGVGVPVGLRVAEGGLLRPRDAVGTTTAPLSHGRTGAGVRGRRQMTGVRHRT